MKPQCSFSMMQIHLRRRTECLLPQRFLIIATLLLSGLGSTQAMAKEPVLEFLEGLRGRRYFDSALYYIDSVEKDPSIPAEAKVTLPYERGQTLLQSAKDLTNLDAQRKQLDRAQAAFEAFVKAHPKHDLAGRANSARGQILLEKARVDIWDGDKPSNAGNQENFRTAARAGIRKARGIFEQARIQHEASWKKFPAFIPEDQPAARAQRNEAEELFIRAQLDLAQCTYWEAQTYDKGTKERIAELQKAAAEFEAIHQQYRSQLGGLFARIWQGKCFEEQGNAEGIRIALGIYGEILEHDGTTAAMRNLKDRALRFRLICLNYPERHDYELVIQEAEAWLKEARDRSRTDVGMGIQWELCRAQESLGTDRTKPEAVRNAYLNQALNRARAINRYPGELKTTSSAMIQRIMVALNRDPTDPKDFDTAYGNGGQLYEQVAAGNAAIRKLQNEGKKKEAAAQHEALMATAAEMTRMYDLALRLATPNNDQVMVNIARLRLSYGYLLQQRYFDAAVVADDQMSRFGEEFPEVAREAGFLAMTAFDNAYANAPEDDREFETRQVVEAANKICERWPDSDRANDARNTVAKIYWNDGDLIAAAQWWEKIPKGTAQYGDAQVRAGKAYWRQYVLATSQQSDKPGVVQPSQEELAKWKKAAIDHLSIGIQEAERNTPANSSLSDDIVGAKLTLVSIRNLDGLYRSNGKGPRGALELLTKDPHPILKAVDVPKGTERPKDPTKAKSRQMASFAYQQLLRVWVGLKNLEEARKARVALEEVASGGDEAALTQVFVDFGRELERELNRLKAAGDKKRLDDVRAGFESFLNDLFKRKDGQTFYSLLWIAETYTSLAESAKDDSAKSNAFFDKASTAYRHIIDSAAADSDFANAQQLLACKLRLVNCLRQQQDYEEGEKVLANILKANPNAPDAQFEAAQLYQEWGANGSGDAVDKFKIALYGKKTPVHVWGWTYAAQSLQQALYRQKDDRLSQLHFDARYHLAEAEKEYGLALSDPKESRRHLDRARAGITGFLRVSKRWPDSEYRRFNELYKSILADMGEATIDLPRELNDSERVEPVAQTADSQKGEAVPAMTPEPVLAPPEPPPAKNNTLLIILVVVLGIGAVVGLYFLAVLQGKKKSSRYASSGNAAPVTAESARESMESVPDFGSLGTGGTAVKAGPPRTKKASSAPVFSPIQTGTSTAAAKPAAAKPAVAKPRPKSAASGQAGASKPTGKPVPGKKGGVKPTQGTRPSSGKARPARPDGTKPTSRPRPSSQQDAAGKASRPKPKPSGGQKPSAPKKPRPKPPENP